MASRNENGKRNTKGRLPHEEEEEEEEVGAKKGDRASAASRLKSGSAFAGYASVSLSTIVSSFVTREGTPLLLVEEEEEEKEVAPAEMCGRMAYKNAAQEAEWVGWAIPLSCAANTQERGGGVQDARSVAVGRTVSAVVEEEEEMFT